MNQKLQKIIQSLSLVGLGKEKNFFLENFANLLLSGMPLLDAIKSVAHEIKHKALQDIINAMSDDINSGLSLAETMQRSGLFSAHVISLIDIGQTSGRLNENIQIIVTEQKKSQEMRGKIRSAIMYPVFVLVLVLVVGTGIAWFILPKLASVFNGLKLKVPPITKALMDFGQFLEQHGIIVVPLFFMFLGFCFYMVFFNKKTKFLGEIFLFHCPGLKRMMLEAELAKFGFLLGTLFSAGLSPIESLDSMSKSTNTIRYRKLYNHIKVNMSDGFSFKQSFDTYPKINVLMPSSLQQILIAGEQSGMLSETLLKIGENYERRIETTTKDLSVMLEPILLIVVWAGVVGLALAVIMPIYGLIGGLK